MDFKVRDLLYYKKQSIGTYYKVVWDLLYKMFFRYGTYLNILWVLLEGNEGLKRLKVNTVMGLADIVFLLIDLNRYKYNRITIYVSNETMLF